jgi:hypothetical protein
MFGLTLNWRVLGDEHSSLVWQWCIFYNINTYVTRYQFYMHHLSSKYFFIIQANVNVMLSLTLRIWHFRLAWKRFCDKHSSLVWQGIGDESKNFMTLTFGIDVILSLTLWQFKSISYGLKLSQCQWQYNIDTKCQCHKTFWFVTDALTN